MSLLGSPTFDLLAILIILLNIAYFIFTRNFNFWHDLGVNFVKPVPYLGSIKDIAFRKVSIGHFLYDVYFKYRDEPCVGMFSFNRPILVAIDNKLVRNVLVKDSQIFLDRILKLDEKVDQLGAKGLFMMKGEKWRYLRQNLSPTFTSGKMKNMFYLMENCAKGLDEFLDKTTADGSPVDVKETMARFTTDVISSCAFGIDSNSLKNPDAEFRIQLRKVFVTTPSKIMRSLLSAFCPPLLKVIKLKAIEPSVAQFVRTTLWSTAKYRETHGIVRKDFLDNLMDLRRNLMAQEKENQQSQFKVDDDDYAAQAFTFLTAGFETSSTTISFALYELSVNQETQSKLRDEICQVLQKYNNQITYDGIQEMKYLEMVVQETLRKYPILPYLERQSVTEYEIPAPSGKGTIKLPQGIGVYIPLMAIHHDPEYFPEPEKFDPERFTEESKQMRPNYTHMPFGEGPRFCIGMRFGLMQVKTGLIHILSRYEVTPCKDTQIPLNLNKRSFMLTTQSEIKLSFKKIVT